MPKHARPQRPSRHRRLVIGLMLLLGGCASVNFDYPKTESTYLENTGDTTLGRRIADVVAAHPGESAFLMQNDGVDALAARVLGAFHAEKTIDVQYYLIKADAFGFVFIEALLDAADRGVRVRVLVDDVFTKGYDEGLAALDEHPNVQIRIWNPVARGGSRLLNGLREAGRVNRRMHNKTFIVDNQVAIIGGRNVAAEYFAGRQDRNFGDLDTLCFGPIVQELSTMYDLYWNDYLAVPIDALVDPPENLEKVQAGLRAKILKSRLELGQTHYGQVLLGRVWQLDAVGSEQFDWARWELVYDLPRKGRDKNLDADETIVTPLRETLTNAEESALILTPYFVPRKEGLALISHLRDRGVEVRIVTNSLASNNQKLVHSGYAPVRKKLLAMGVKLYEVRPDARPIGVQQLDEAENDDSQGTLHTKAFIVDRRTFFLGSFNFDPRSAWINTESGVIIDTPELSAWGVDRVNRYLPTVAYELRLTDNNQLRWHTLIDGEEVVYTRDPQTTGWQRFKVKLWGLLPIKDQL